MHNETRKCSGGPGPLLAVCAAIVLGFGTSALRGQESGGLISAKSIVKQIEVEGRASFSEEALLFKFDSTELANDRSRQQVAEIGKALADAKFQNAKFVVQGHTCDLGSDEYNLALSRRRAEAIRDMLVSQYGIVSGRLKVEGKGESEPAVPNYSDANRSKNRRVVVALVTS
jgi:outer membrane protein OmpA-like peptidoglycan-associated protein